MNMTPTRKTPFSWTFSSLGCPEATLTEAIELARAHGLNQLELRTLEDRVDLPALFAERHGDPESLKGFLKREGMQVVSLDASLKLVGNSPADRADLLEFLPWAEALGTPWLRIFDGGTFAPELGEADLAAALDTLAWWRGERKRHGWKADVMIETHDCLTASTALAQLQEALDEPAAVLWDSHHTWKKGGEDPAATWKALRGPVPHIHVKDSISKPSDRHPFTYVQLGEGEFPLQETIDLLEAAGFAGVVSIEWERKWHPYLQPLDSALKRARELGWW